MVKRIIIAIVVLSLCACDRIDFTGFLFPTGEVVDVRFEQSMTMTQNKPYCTIGADESYSFYVATDIHITSSDDSANLHHFLNALRNDSTAPLGVILGDCIDRKGLFPAFIDMLQYDNTTQLYNRPLMYALGNHDVYFNGWDTFKELIGPAVYYFTVGADLYIVLDSATGTLGAKQTAWLKELLASQRVSYRYCFILTHTNFFNSDASQALSGCMPLEETMQLLDLFDQHSVTLVLQGHDHFREELTMKGVQYTIVGALETSMKRPEYLRVSVTPHGLTYDWYEIVH